MTNGTAITELMEAWTRVSDEMVVCELRTSLTQTEALCQDLLDDSARNWKGRNGAFSTPPVEH